MRFTLFAAFGLLFLFQTGFAQLPPSQQRAHQARIDNSVRLNKTVWSYDTVFHSGEAYAIQRPVGNSNRDFSIFALNNSEEMILVQNLQRIVQGGIEVQFRFLVEPGGTATVRAPLGVRDYVATLLYDEKLLTSEGLDAKSVANFMKKYGGTFERSIKRNAQNDEADDEADEETDAAPALTPADEKALANRSRTAALLCLNNQIEQDNLIIGSWREEADPDVTGGKQITIFDPNNQPVASAHLLPKGGIFVITARDHKEHTLNLGTPELAVTDFHVDAVVRFLVKRFYM